MEPFGKAFVNLIKMMIAPIIFCTVVVGVGSIAKAATVGKIVGLVRVLVFRVLGMVLWLAPIGGFGAIAAVVGKTGFAVIISLGILMIAFYITCIVFIVGVLGVLLYTVTRFSIFRLMK